MKKTLLLLLVSLFFGSCAVSIEKRHFRSGYYVSFPREKGFAEVPVRTQQQAVAVTDSSTALHEELKQTEISEVKAGTPAILQETEKKNIVHIPETEQLAGQPGMPVDEEKPPGAARQAENAGKLVVISFICLAAGFLGLFGTLVVIPAVLVAAALTLAIIAAVKANKAMNASVNDPSVYEKARRVRKRASALIWAVGILLFIAAAFVGLLLLAAPSIDNFYFNF